MSVETFFDEFGENHYRMTLPACKVATIAMSTKDDTLTSTLRRALAAAGVDDIGVAVFFDTTPVPLDLVATEAATVSYALSLEHGGE